MIVAIDVRYHETQGFAAGVAFNAWPDEQPASTHSCVIDDVREYEPGAFWKRELPCILELLAQMSLPLTTVVVDGYVWLDGEGRRGLGAHLFEALDGQVPIVGVAKTAFRRSAHAAHVLRGGSTRPLFVTAVGMPLDVAQAAVAQMAGSHRLPTLLKQVDQLSRGRN